MTHLPTTPKEKTMTTSYTATDSLSYLADDTLLDIAIEALEDLKEHEPSVQLDTALEVIRTMEKIIDVEAAAHNATVPARYSNGIPVNVTYEDEEGILTTRTLHPSGSFSHPSLSHCANHA